MAGQKNLAVESEYEGGDRSGPGVNEPGLSSALVPSPIGPADDCLFCAC